MLAQRGVRGRFSYEAAPAVDRWTLEEEQVPESRSHDQIADRLCKLLTYRMKLVGRDAQIGRNLAIRFDELHPRSGIDPDVYLLEPPPPERDELTSLRLWETGHSPPRLAVEIVSPSRANKDYSESPEKYAACGAEELWVFDPKLAGPRAHGGPYRLQIWRADEEGFTRTYAGDGPAYSPVVGGFLFAVNEGRSLAISDNDSGDSFWMTGEEAERAAKEEALRRVAELEARLAAAERAR
jgi:Uma2 family endonuclease